MSAAEGVLGQKEISARILMTGLAAAVSVASTGAFAQGICTPWDKGELGNASRAPGRLETH